MMGDIPTTVVLDFLMGVDALGVLLPLSSVAKYFVTDVAVPMRASESMYDSYIKRDTITLWCICVKDDNGDAVHESLEEPPNIPVINGGIPRSKRKRTSSSDAISCSLLVPQSTS